MHRLCTRHKILCTDIVHGRAIDYARVLKYYTEVFAIPDRLHTRARKLCTDYAHATKYYARRLCTDYAWARHRLCTGTKRLCGGICNSVHITPACSKIMHGLCTRHKILCTEILHRLRMGTPWTCYQDCAIMFGHEKALPCK